MLHPSTKKLIDRLVTMTAEGKIDWVEAEGDNVSYTTEGYSVTLEIEPNEMVIKAEDGRELERATVAELADAKGGDGAPYTQYIADMTREAVRKAKGIDKAITTLLAGIDLDGDGVPDVPIENLEEDIAEANAIIEDVGDESAIVTADDVDSLEAEATAVEEAEVDIEVPDVESPVAAEEAVTEADTHQHVADEDVTEAVARLADEVNGRQEEHAETVVSTQEQSEDQSGLQEEAVDQTPADVEPLHETHEPTSEVTETTESDSTESASAILGIGAAGLAASAFVASTTEDKSEEDESEAQTVVSDADVIDTTEASSSPDLQTIETEGAHALEDDVTPEIEVSPVPAVSEISNDEHTGEVHAEESIVDTSTASDEVEVTPEVAEVDISVEEETQSVAFDADEESTPIKQADEPEDTPQTDTHPVTQEISLSGLGAGFGLGALQVKGEASGVPSVDTSEVSPSAIVEEAAPAEDLEVQPEPKLVIDSTDEVVLTDAEPLDGGGVAANEDLPQVSDIQATETDTVESSTEEADAEDQTETEDEVSMTPKTRFNPWT
ncbi:MAG: hypothetical protein AAGG45_00010 [Pseudomonadota bacterium]